MSKVMIYSNEHKGWWKPYYFGYTQCSKEAGIFDLEDAIKKYPKLDYDTSNEDFLVDVSVEAIDNANPSEALKILETLADDGLLNKEIGTISYNQIWLKNQIEILQQALLKAQEPKQYLKWEDLEFKKKVQGMKVKLGDNTYEIEYYICNALDLPKSVVILKTSDFIAITIEQFFNDLHLERVEEWKI